MLSCGLQGDMDCPARWGLSRGGMVGSEGYKEKQRGGGGGGDKPRHALGLGD